MSNNADKKKKEEEKKRKKIDAKIPTENKNNLGAEIE